MLPPPYLRTTLTQLRGYAKRLQFSLERPADGICAQSRELTLEWLVQVAVECAAHAGDQQPAASGVPTDAAAAGVVQEDLHARWRDQVTARNRVIHACETIAPKRLE